MQLRDIIFGLKEQIIEFAGDDVIKLFLEFYMLTAWSERASCNRHVLTISGKYCQNRLITI